MKAIVIGATGATGRELIKILLLRSEVKHILAFTRKKLDVSLAKRCGWKAKIGFLKALDKTLENFKKHNK